MDGGCTSALRLRLFRRQSSVFALIRGNMSVLKLVFATCQPTSVASLSLSCWYRLRATHLPGARSAAHKRAADLGQWRRRAAQAGTLAACDGRGAEGRRFQGKQFTNTGSRNCEFGFFWANEACGQLPALKVTAYARNSQVGIAF